VVQVAAPLQAVDQRATPDDLNIRLSAAITGTVDDLLSIEVVDDQNRPLADVQRVIVDTQATTPAGQFGERFDADSAAEDPTTYTFPAIRLGVSGEWAIDVTVRRAGKPDSTSRFSIDTTPWTVPSPEIRTRSWTRPIVPLGSWALISLSLIVATTGLTIVRRQQNVAPLSGAILFIALAMISTGFVIQAWQRMTPRTNAHELVSAPDSDSIAAAENFRLFCIACHGVDGAGLDTVDPNHQHGSGTNLVDARTSLLSDGDIFGVISDGTVGSDMPAYRVALTEAERWDLVHYVRFLQESTRPEPSPTP
jgi:mono/diheme cytochrome c family protein